MNFQRWINRLGSEIIPLAVNCFQATENQGTTEHAHPGQLHIACFEKGGGSCTVNGIDHKIHPGDIYVIFPGEMHRFIPRKDNPYKACFLHFSWFGSLPAELPPELKIPKGDRRRFFQLCQELSDTIRMEDGTAEKEFIFYSLLLRLWGELLRFARNCQLSKSLSRPSTGISRLLNPVIEKLHGPPFFYPGIDELAEQNNLSRRNLTKLFRQHTGCGIKQYDLANVMHYAKSVREKQSMTTAELARQCGYSTAQNFLLAYKKYFSTHSEESNAGKVFIWKS